MFSVSECCFLKLWAAEETWRKKFQKPKNGFRNGVGKKFEKVELKEMIISLGIEENDKQKAERMIKVALSCVQDKPEIRPLTSVVVNVGRWNRNSCSFIFPFKHLLIGSSGTHDLQAASATWIGSTF